MPHIVYTDLPPYANRPQPTIQEGSNESMSESEMDLSLSTTPEEENPKEVQQYLESLQADSASTGDIEQSQMKGQRFELYAEGDKPVIIDTRGVEVSAAEIFADENNAAAAAAAAPLTSRTRRRKGCGVMAVCLLVAIGVAILLAGTTNREESRSANLSQAISGSNAVQDAGEFPTTTSSSVGDSEDMVGETGDSEESPAEGEDSEEYTEGDTPTGGEGSEEYTEGEETDHSGAEGDGNDGGDGTSDNDGEGEETGHTDGDGDEAYEGDGNHGEDDGTGHSGGDGDGDYEGDGNHGDGEETGHTDGDGEGDYEDGETGNNDETPDAEDEEDEPIFDEDCEEELTVHSRCFENGESISLSASLCGFSGQEWIGVYEYGASPYYHGYNYMVASHSCNDGGCEGDDAVELDDLPAGWYQAYLLAGDGSPVTTIPFLVSPVHCPGQ